MSMRMSSGSVLHAEVTHVTRASCSLHACAQPMRDLQVQHSTVLEPGQVTLTSWGPNIQSLMPHSTCRFCMEMKLSRMEVLCRR